MPQGILRPSHSVLSPHLRSFMPWFNSSPESAYLMRYSRTRERTSRHGWWGSWISSWALQPSKQLPTTRRRMVLWRDSTKLARTCFGSSLQTQDETGTSGCHLFSSLTKKYPKRQRDSHRSSSSMDGRYKDPWTCWWKAGRRNLHPRRRKASFSTC